jgi:hypothetical protein
LQRLEKMAKQKVAVEVHKLLAEVAGLLTVPELPVQLARYSPVEPVVPAISTVEAVEAVATSVEAAAVLTPTVSATMLEPEVADLLSLILATHRMSRTLLESKVAMEW